jgi:transcriptional regulator with XRE-family HTH domain
MLYGPRLLLVANFPHEAKMNFSQLQDRVRHVLLRRIERGTLSVSLLARQTGMGQPHISNFLRGRRGLSLGTLDRILAAQKLEISDFLPARREANAPVGGSDEDAVEAVVRLPLVGGAVAVFEPYIRASSVQGMVPFAGEVLKGLEVRCSAGRKQWDRFVVVRVTEEDGRAMGPMLEEGGLVVLDRHYTSFYPYAEGKVTVYGARAGAGLVLRLAQFEADRVVLRALRGEVKAVVVEPEGAETAGDVLVGRVVVYQYRDERRGMRDQGPG